MAASTLQRELKRGSAELLILALLEERQRHGYEIGRLIETRSGGQMKFHAASLYPLLYRLEERGWIAAEWGESENNRRARYYSLTRAGRTQLEAEMANWRRLSLAIGMVLDGAEG